MKYVVVKGLQSGIWTELFRLSFPDDSDEDYLKEACQQLSDGIREGKISKMSSVYGDTLTYVDYKQFAAIKMTWHAE